VTTRARLSRCEWVATERASVTVAAVGDGDVRARRIASLLARAGFDVVIEESDLTEHDWLGNSAPDVAVVACERLDDAKTWIRVLREHVPDTRLVAVTSFVGRHVFRAAIEEGVDGVVLEAEEETCLPITIDAVRSGQLVVPRVLREHMAKPALSTREKQILGMVVMGFTNSEIAGKLFLAESTVKSHLSSAFVKMGVRSRSEATALILDAENGLGTGILAISDAGLRAPRSRPSASAAR
jgi:DNA-binding NarL/FixJ family response regulator